MKTLKTSKVGKKFYLYVTFKEGKGKEKEHGVEAQKLVTEFMKDKPYTFSSYLWQGAQRSEEVMHAFVYKQSEGV